MLTKWAKKIIAHSAPASTGVLSLNIAGGSNSNANIEARSISGDVAYIHPTPRSTTAVFISGVLVNSTINYSKGFAVGSDGTAPTENDYTLGNQIIDVLSATIGDTITVYDSTNNKYKAYLDLTISNNGSSDVVIREIGRFVGCGSAAAMGDTVSTSNVDMRCIMIDRTVLDVPVTIPSGEAGVVRYEFTYN